MTGNAPQNDPRRQRVESIFARASEAPRESRASLLAELCAGDDGLRREVESLLRHFDAGTMSLLDPSRSRVFEVPAEHPGDVIGPYTILEALGEGGFGSVYLAEQSIPVKRRVALKVLKAGMDTRAVLARFDAERQTLALMDHPGIARVLDAGSTPAGRPFFVMELVRGSPLVAFCDERRMSLRERLDLFLDVCRAVQHAHQRGIIHRDLKPSNILVEEHDGRAAPKVIDFGIAKAVHQPLLEVSLATQQGQLIGTPEYMSPEQAGENAADIDTRTDVYSLGVILYELVTGALPFDSASLRASLAQMQRLIRATDPPRPSARLNAIDAADARACAERRNTDLRSLARALRGDLEWIILKSIEKERARRYDTVADLAADIERHLHDEPVLAGPPSRAYRLAKFVRRHRVGVAAGSAVALALAVGAVAAGIGFLRASEQRDRAVAAEHEAVRRGEEAVAARDRAQAAEKEAVEQRKNTERARDSARIEAAKARAVNAFLQRMLSSVKPNEARGREVTVKMVLDQSAGQIDKEFAGEPDILDELHQTIGSTYLSLERYDDAEKHVRAALASRNARLAPDDPGRISTNVSWIIWLTEKGRFAEAEDASRAIVKDSEAPGFDPVQRARCLSILGRTLVKRSRLAEAETALRAALELQRTLPGVDRANLGDTIDGLARALDSQGKDAEALTLFNECLALRRELYGELSAAVGTVLNNVASVLHDMDRLDEAEAMYRQSMAVHEKVSGRESIAFVQPLNNLAILLQNKGDLDGAEAAMRESLATRRKILGESNPTTLNAMGNLGGLLMVRGKHEQALDFFEDAYAAQRESLGDRHNQTIVAQNNIGRVLTILKRYDDAADVLTASRLIALRAFGPDHRTTIIATVNLGQNEETRGNPAGAEGWYREALDTRLRVLGPDHTDTRFVQRLLSGARLAQGDLTEARRLAWDACDSLNRAKSVAASERRFTDGLMKQLCETP